MTDWSGKISSATVGPRDYGQGVVIGYWNGIVTSGSVEEATEKHGWPLVIEPFDKNRLFREINKLESKVEEMQKALQRIDNIAESCGAEAHIVRKMVQEALKGVETE